MIKKYKIVFLIFMIICYVLQIPVIANEKPISNSRVSMQPVTYYYDMFQLKQFHPSKKIKKDAKKIYQKMLKEKTIKIKYKDTNKNMLYWYKVYSYLTNYYFRYTNGVLNPTKSSTNGIYNTDIFKKKTYKKFFKKNNQNKKLIKNTLNEININQNTKVVDALEQINQYLINTCSYFENYANDKTGYLGYNQTLDKYAFLRQKEGVCIDYAYTFQILCQEIGIPCACIKDNSMSHAYNLCLIDNKEYYFDVTWNDCGYKDKFSFMDKNDINSQNRQISKIEWNLH